MLIDTHAHINDACYFSRLDDLVGSLKENNIEKVFCVGADISSSKRALEIAHKFENIYAIVGVHPTEFERVEDIDFDYIDSIADDPKVIAIGEIGLDYHFENCPSKADQRRVFERQIDIADKHALPISIHLRDACGDLIDILKANSKKLHGGLIHCYSESFESYKIFKSLGFKVAFGGSITFKNATKLSEVARLVPLEDIVLETDCPYMTPVPYRGKENEPKYVELVAEKLCELKGVALQEVIDTTTKNAYQVFKKVKE